MAACLRHDGILAERSHPRASPGRTFPPGPAHFICEVARGSRLAVSCAMGKKYKGKTCVYCAEEGVSKTRDHVLAREFVLERHRANLPVVPACTACNNLKSRLEASLTTLLPFGGRHPDAVENLSTMVPKRLQANATLRSKIGHGLDNQAWVPTPGGILHRTTTIPIDASQMEAWISYLTLGLIFHHWRSIVSGLTNVTPMLLTAEGERLYAPVFGLKAARRVPVTTIGGGALTYEGVMDTTNSLASAWRFAIYGGIQLGGDDPRERASTYYVTVIPRADVRAA